MRFCFAGLQTGCSANIDWRTVGEPKSLAKEVRLRPKTREQRQRTLHIVPGALIQLVATCQYTPSAAGSDFDEDSFVP